MRKIYFLLLTFLFFVTAKSQTTAVKEVEPNNTFSTATPITTNPAKMKGNVFPNADTDWYSFTATAGDKIYAAVITSFSASASTDAQLRLYASDGTTLIEFDEDDGSFGSLSSTIAGATIPTTGTYYLEVKHFSATNTLRGYDLYLKKQTGLPTPEVEGNDTPATANPLPGNGWVSGTRNPALATEQDWFSLTLAAGETIFLSMDLDPERDNVQYNGRLGVALFGDANNQILVVDDASTGSAANPLSEAMVFTAKTAGTYYVFADAASAAVGGPTATYNISVSTFAATPGYVNYPSVDIPKTIGPGATAVTSTINIPDSKLISDISIRVDLNHTFMSQIDAVLTTPNGNTIHLFSDIGATSVGGQTLMDAVFNDNNAIPPVFTVLRPVGYQPELNCKLDMLKGMNTQGVWTLTLYDDIADANGGTLNNWSIDVLEFVPPSIGGLTTIVNEDFEATDGGFTHSGAADEWEYGTPATIATTTTNPVAGFTTANSGTKCWKTDLDNTYNISSLQTLESPTYDLTTVTGPIWLSWAMKHQMESATFDSLRVYVEEIGGPALVQTYFQWLGATATASVGSPAVNIGLAAGWGIHWVDISAFAGKQIRFKVRLGSDNSINFGGVAIDDVKIYGTTACTPSSITLGASPAVCSGTTAANLPYTATTGTPNIYSIDYDAAAQLAGFVDVVNAALPASPIALTVPGAAPAAVYNATITVQNNVGGCVSPAVAFTVTVNATNTVTLTSAPGTNAQTVCINTAITNITYSTTGATGATFSGLPAGVTGSWAANVVTISGSPTTTVGSPFTYTVTLTGGCGVITANGTITVTPNNTITLTSAAGTNAQTVCINTAITNITYSTTGATGATFSGLPAGVTGNWAANVVTISGSPTTTVGSPFSYTVTLTGGCGTITANGTITVTPDNTITLTSAAGTNAQTVCINTAITNITYATTGATGATFSGLPAGVTGAWAANVVTISGSPTTTVGSPFSYTVTLTGGCGTITANGTITVTPNNTITLTSAAGTNAQSVCLNTAITNITYATTGATGATFSGLPAGVTGAWAANVVTISGTPTTTVGSPFSYTVTLTGGCGSITANGTITVRPLPVISSTQVEPTTCVSADGSITLTLSGAAGPYTFAWTGPGVNPTSQNQTGLTVGAYSVIVTAANGCTTTANFALSGPGGCSICPTIPTFTTTPAGAACAGSNVTFTASGLTNMGITYGIIFKYSAVALVNPYVGGTLIATVPNGGLTSGGTVATANSASIPVGSYFVYAILTPTPVDPLCRPAASVNLTIGAVPDVNQPANQVVCNNTPTAAVNFTGSVPGTVFNWTNNTPSIGLAASGTGNIASFTATNATASPVVATVTVTPAYTTTTLSPVTATFTYTGAMQTWTVPAGVTSITIDSYGAQGGNGAVGNSGSGGVNGGTGGNGSRATGTLAVTPGQVLNIFVGGAGTTGTGGFNGGGNGGNANAGGGGGASDVRFPGATTADRIIVGAGGGGGGRGGCEGSGTAGFGGNGGIGDGNGANGGNSPTPGGLAGGGFGAIGSAFGAKGIGCAGFSGQDGTAGIASGIGGTGGNGQTCCCFSFGSIPGGGGGGGGFVGGGGAGGGSAGTAGCSGNDKGAGGGGAGGSSYTGGVTAGVTTTGVQSGNGQVVISYALSSVTCTGTPRTFTITVNPTPTAVATPASQTVCSGVAITTIAITGNAVAGVVYNWTRDNTVAATGIAASGAGNISGTLTNTTTAPVTVTFTITPTANGCAGTPITATVLVNPTPTAVATPASQTVCSGVAITTIVITGNAVAGVVYNWTRDNTVAVTGIAASGSGNISGTLTNTTNAPVTVTFTITPTANGCAGTPITATVLVNPTPNAVATPASQTICSAATITTIVLSGNVSGTVYNWTRDNTVAVTGIAASGAGNISGTLTNTTNAPVTVTFTITPTANGCPGTPITATVLVNPTPNAVATPASQTICSAAAITTIVLSGNVSGTVYNWTRDNTVAVTGIAGSGAGNISGTLTNTTNAPVTVTFTITPTANGCPGTPITATVLVNPTPNAVATPASQAVCSAFPITTIVMTGNVGGTIYNWTRDNTVTVTGMAASGSGNISGSLINATAAPITVTFTITPTANGCPGTPVTATVTVTPQPAATIVYAGNPYCSTDLTAPVTRTGTAGGTYSAAPAGLTINAVTGTVTPNTSTPGTYTVTYTVAPAGGCLVYTTTTTITITAAPNMIIFYAGTPYCSNAGTATVSQFGTTGGTYSATPAGLTINAATGAVTLGTSTPGTYTVTYSVTVPGCGITNTTTTITITAAPNASIAYAGTPYCSNAGTANVTFTGTAGGTYTAAPVGLSINAATGAVNLPASTAGTYTITYTVATGGGCATFTTTTTITITTLPAATIAYTGSPYCSNAGTANVTRTGTAGGTYTAAAGLSINAATGAVNLAASTAGTYTVTYTLAAGGGCPVVTATASITITALPAATITYAGSPYCQPGGTATVTRTGSAGGTYSATPAGLVINAANGDINIGASTSGTYTVTYTLAAGGGCGVVTATTSVTINAISVAATAATASSTALCGPGSVTLGITGGVLGSGATWRWYTGSCGGTSVGTGATLNVTVNATTTYFVRAEGPCNTTTCASVTVTVNAQPTISIAASPRTTLLPGQTTTLTATVTPAAGNTITWYRNGNVVPGATGLTLLVSVSDLGTYTARATTGAGCTALSNDVTIIAEGSALVFVFPNPSRGQFQVRVYNQQGKQISVLVHNARGQRVYFERKITSAPYTRMDVDLRSAAAGQYTVTVVDSDDQIIGTRSIIIYH